MTMEQCDDRLVRAGPGDVDPHLGDRPASSVRAFPRSTALQPTRGDDPIGLVGVELAQDPVGVEGAVTPPLAACAARPTRC